MINSIQQLQQLMHTQLEHCSPPTFSHQHLHRKSHVGPASRHGGRWLVGPLQGTCGLHRGGTGQESGGAFLRQLKADEDDLVPQGGSHCFCFLEFWSATCTQFQVV